MKSWLQPGAVPTPMILVYMFYGVCPGYYRTSGGGRSS